MDGGLFAFGEIAGERADGFRPLGIASPEEADRPVGAEHDVSGSEDFEGFVEVSSDGFVISFAFGEFC